jgi:hypothetical protein
LCAGEIVGGKKPEGYDLDPDLLTPGEELGDLVCPGSMPMGGRTALNRSPTTIAIKDDADMVGRALTIEGGHELTFVYAVGKIPQPHLSVTSNRLITHHVTRPPNSDKGVSA